jgi:membrane-associated protein
MNTDLTALALNWVASYGSPMVAGLLLVGAVGLPLPLTLLVIASGAFIRQDLLDFSTPVLALLGTVLGDMTLFGISYFAHPQLEKRFGQTSGWLKASEMFARRGGLAIFLTRWLFTALAFPVTLIAGGSGYRFRRFLLMDTAGELLWLALYGGLGYAFGSQWELISEFISDFSGFLLGGLALALGVFLLLRFGKKRGPLEVKPDGVKEIRTTVL